MKISTLLASLVSLVGFVSAAPAPNSDFDNQQSAAQYGVQNALPPPTPSGGLGTNGSLPYYHPLSDFDFQSIVRLYAFVRSQSL